MERDKAPEIPDDLYCVLCHLRHHFLLSALGGLDYGIPEL